MINAKIVAKTKNDIDVNLLFWIFQLNISVFMQEEKIKSKDLSCDYELQ